MAVTILENIIGGIVKRSRKTSDPCSVMPDKQMECCQLLEIALKIQVKQSLQTDIRPASAVGKNSVMNW